MINVLFILGMFSLVASLGELIKVFDNIKTRVGHCESDDDCAEGFTCVNNKTTKT